MIRRMFVGKIHRATVTHADLHYEGSVTVDAELLSASGILENEQVHIWNITRGTRLTTYALPAAPGSAVVCINGAAAHHNQVGDLVIIAAFADMEADEARAHQPRIVLVDSSNRIVSQRAEIPGPQQVSESQMSDC